MKEMKEKMSSPTSASVDRKNKQVSHLNPGDPSFHLTNKNQKISLEVMLKVGQVPDGPGGYSNGRLGICVDVKLLLKHNV